MTSSTVQIISILAPIGAVVLGFALGVCWNNYQQKKRDEREIKAFLIRLEADLYYKIILLLDVERMFDEYKTSMSKGSSFIWWPGVPNLRKSFDIPLSFSIKHEKLSKQLYQFEGQMIYFNNNVQAEKEALDEIKQHSLKDREAGKSNENTLYNLRREEKGIDGYIPYVKGLIKEISGYYYTVSVQFNKRSEEECQKELQKAFDRRKHREPVAHKVS